MRTVLRILRESLLACWLLACGSSAGTEGPPAHRPVVVAAPPPEASAASEQPQPARCAAGETLDSCFERALKLAKGDGVAKDTRTAFELFLSGCSLGSSGACNSAGWGFIHGYGGKEDPAAAGRFFARGCPTGNEDVYACDSRGFALLTGFAETKRDVDLATGLLVNACLGGIPHSCIALNLYAPLGIPQQVPLRPDLKCGLDLTELEHVCIEQSGPQECWLAAMMTMTGTCVEADQDRGLELHRAAFALGVPWPPPEPTR